MNPTIKSITDSLRYRAIPDFIGTSILIQKLEDVEAVVTDLLSPSLPVGAMRNSMQHVSGVLAKYNMMDLTFDAPQIEIGDSDIQGLNLLKQLGFVPGSRCFLGYLAKELEEEQTVIRVFLRGEQDIPFTRNSVAESHLPQRFVVRDICITNAPGVWFYRHFYM